MSIFKDIENSKKIIQSIYDEINDIVINKKNANMYIELISLKINSVDIFLKNIENVLKIVFADKEDDGKCCVSVNKNSAASTGLPVVSSSESILSNPLVQEFAK